MRISSISRIFPTILYEMMDFGITAVKSNLTYLKTDFLVQV